MQMTGEIKWAEKMGLNRGIKRELNVLVKNEKDADDFMAHFWLGKNMQATSLNNYRQCKLHERNMGLEEFINLYQIDPIKGLEELFMQQVCQEDVDKLEKEIAACRLSLGKLYDLHKYKPMERLRYFLLRRV
jgi:hypothetical protein